jgi:hypothetical protein
MNLLKKKPLFTLYGEDYFNNFRDELLEINDFQRWMNKEGKFVLYTIKSKFIKKQDFELTSDSPTHLLELIDMLGIDCNYEYEGASIVLKCTPNIEEDVSEDDEGALHSFSEEKFNKNPMDLVEDTSNNEIEKPNSYCKDIQMYLLFIFIFVLIGWIVDPKFLYTS